MIDKSPSTQDPAFYEARDFNQIGKPLVLTVERSKLASLKWADIHKVSGLYRVSIKTDGKFVRIIKKGNLIRMITSSGLDFYHNRLAELMQPALDGQYNMELQWGDGLLRSRDKTGYLTTACADYRNQLPSAGEWPDDELCFQVHDFLPLMSGNEYQLMMDYGQRRNYMEASFQLMFGNFFPYVCKDVALLRYPDGVTVYIDEKNMAVIPELVKENLTYMPALHEGLVFMHLHEHYRLPINPRNFKLKNVREVIGTVISVEADKNGGNGTLVLEVIDGPPNGQECRVSSGIDSKLRSAHRADILYKKVEVEYESITADGHYNQPRIKRFDV